MTSTSSFLLHSGEKGGPSSLVHSDNTLSLILETEFAGVGGGGFSFYLKQT